MFQKKLFGQTTRYHIVNETIMASKQVIYPKRQEGRNSSVTLIRNLLNKQMCTEEDKEQV